MEVTEITEVSGERYLSPREKGEMLRLVGHYRGQTHLILARAEDVGTVICCYSPEDGRPVVAVDTGFPNTPLLFFLPEPGEESGGEELPQFLDWYGVTESEREILTGWLETPKQEHPSPFFAAHNHDRKTGKKILTSVVKDDLRTITCEYAEIVLDGKTATHRRLVYGKDCPEFIRDLAKWRGVDPQIWLDWVGYSEDDDDGKSENDDDAREEAA